MEEDSWRGNHGGCIMDESSLGRQPGGGRQEKAATQGEAVSRRQPGGTRRHPGGARREPGGPQEAPRRHQEAARSSREAPRSVSVFVFVSVPILLLVLGVFTGPRRLRAAGQCLKDPR